MKKIKLLSATLISVFFALIIAISFIGVGNVFATDEFSSEATSNELDSIVNYVETMSQAEQPEVLTSLKTNLLSDESDSTEITLSKQLTLRDFDNKKKYIYTEFSSGGYAIYDRIGDFVYERTENGVGPFHEYGKNDKLYYGGIANYFVKINSSYQNTVTGEIINKVKGKALSSLTEKTRENQKTQDLLNTETLSSYASNTLYQHYLGENIKNSETQLLAMLYFYGLHQNVNAYFDAYYNMSPAFYSTNNHDDIAFGVNRFGSCSMVAAGILMQYYHRNNFKTMYPDNLSAFTTMYSQNFYYWNAFDYCEKPKTVSLNDDSINVLIGERLHQELIYRAFPEKLEQTTYADNEFGANFTKLKSALTSYFGKHGYNTNINVNTGRNVLEAPIKNGNPVIINYHGKYTVGNQESEVGQHAIVVYGYNAYGVVPYRAVELKTNFGWHQKNYCEVYINSNTDIAETFYLGVF